MKTPADKPEAKSGKSDDLNLPEDRVVKVNANIIKRFLAFILDMIILSFLTLPLQGFIKVEQKHTFLETIQAMTSSPEFGTKMMIVAIFFAIIAILYFTLLESTIKQSVGKMVFRLYVDSYRPAEAKPTGQRPGAWQCFLRNMFFIPFIPFSFIAIADPLFMLWTRENQRLSEIVSRTKVVEYVSVY